MVAARVHHAVTVVGAVSVPLTGVFNTVNVVNWGTVPLFAIAFSSPTLSDPTVSQDDVDVIPVGATVPIQVQGIPYDPGQGGTPNAGTTVKVAAGTAGSAFSVVGLGE